MKTWLSIKKHAYLFIVFDGYICCQKKKEEEEEEEERKEEKGQDSYKPQKLWYTCTCLMVEPFYDYQSLLFKKSVWKKYRYLQHTCYSDSIMCTIINHV